MFGVALLMHLEDGEEMYKKKQDRADGRSCTTDFPRFAGMWGVSQNSIKKNKTLGNDSF